MMTRQMLSTVSSGRMPAMPLDQPPHHRGLARRAEGGAGPSWLFLTGDQACR